MTHATRTELLGIIDDLQTQLADYRQLLEDQIEDPADAQDLFAALPLCFVPRGHPVVLPTRVQQDLQAALQPLLRLYGQLNELRAARSLSAYVTAYRARHVSHDVLHQTVYLLTNLVGNVYVHCKSCGDVILAHHSSSPTTPCCPSCTP